MINDAKPPLDGLAQAEVDSFLSKNSGWGLLEMANHPDLANNGVRGWRIVRELFLLAQEILDDD